MAEQYALAERIVALSRAPSEPPGAWMRETLRLIREDDGDD